MVLDSERAAIGAALKSEDVAEVITAELTDEDFYDETCRKLYGAIKNLSDDGLAITQVSVQERSGIGTSDIEELAYKAAGTTPSQLKTIVSDIRRVAGLRSIYNSCKDTVSSVSKDAKLEEVLEGLEKNLYRLDRAGASEAKDGTDVMQAVIADFIERRNNGGGPEVSTGIQALDKAIIGLRPGKMMILAGRPSMGKTALADTIRRNVVAQGYGVVQFSLEMSAEELLERELSFQAQLNLRKVLAAKEVTDDELARVIAVSGQPGIQGRWFIDDRTYSIAGIRRRARILSGRMARAGIRTGCIVVDYIQLAGENGDGREQSVAAISRGCKLMSKELGCTVLALSQLNRACEYREDRRPMMSDLRESGSLEMDADIVAFVYRESMYDSSVSPEETEILIRKHRSGPTGTVRLRYNPKLVTFEDMPVHQNVATYETTQ
jgi:replicative DNA helicase